MQASSITSTSLTNSNHYEIIFGDNYLKVVANAESHSLAMQAVQAIKTEFGHLYQAHARPIEHQSTTAQEVTLSKPAQSVEPTPSVESAPVREKLRFYADAHIRNMETGQVVRTSLTETKWTMSVFEDLIGNKPLDRITYDDVAKFQDAIREWPANVQNRKDFKELRPRDVIKEGRLLELPPIVDFHQMLNRAFHRKVSHRLRGQLSSVVG